ncbi:MAG: hypothetical protein AAB775_00050 [Patescibacteria group bacterium]
MKKFFLAVALSSIMVVFVAPIFVDALSPGTPVVPGTPSTAGCARLDTSEGGLSGVVSCLIGIINSVVYILIGAAVIVTIWGALQMISSEEKRASGRQTIIYGIVGLFCMISIWGFVNILKSTFGFTSTADSVVPGGFLPNPKK